jgi:hypothetical protein
MVRTNTKNASAILEALLSQVSLSPRHPISLNCKSFAEKNENFFVYWEFQQFLGEVFSLGIQSKVFQFVYIHIA